MNRCFYLYALKFFEKIKENNIVKNAMKRDMLVCLAPSICTNLS